MNQNYAQWDDGPYQQPPRPPRRPSFHEWISMSELEHQAYDAGISAYLMGQEDARWFALLTDMACFYQTWWHEAGRNDPNWKRGGE